MSSALLVLLLIVAGRHVASLEDPGGGHIETGTGDFVAFWTGAVIVHEGRGAELYDYAAQREVQSRILGGESPSYQPYLNPPAFALLLGTLVPLGFLQAFRLYDAFCVAALVGGLAMLRFALPTIVAGRATWWTLVFAVAGWQPMLETTLGGQNTPITFAMLALFVVAWQRRSVAWVAVALGLLTYKPQYALGLGLALAAAGAWRELTAAASLGLLHWLAAAWWCGAAWPLRMLAFEKLQRPVEMAANASNHFSFPAAAEVLLPSPWPAVAGVAALLAVIATWRRFGACASRREPAWTALALVGSMLASPHLQYYDAALLALPVALLVEDRFARGGSLKLRERLGLAAVYVGYPAWELGARLGVQPLFLVLLTIALWSVRAAMDAELRAGAATAIRAAVAGNEQRSRFSPEV